MADEPLRLFLAVMPAAEAGQALLRLAAREAEARGGRILAPDALHLTLCFLGAVPIHRLAAVCTASADLTSMPGCHAVFDRLCLLGHDLLALEASCPAPALLRLQAALRARLTAAGFMLETRRYRPHITLLRHLPARHLPLPAVEALTLRIDHLALIRSQLHPQGSVYSELARWPLRT